MWEGIPGRGGRPPDGMVVQPAAQGVGEERACGDFTRWRPWWIITCGTRGVMDGGGCVVGASRAPASGGVGRRDGFGEPVCVSVSHV